METKAVVSLYTGVVLSFILIFIRLLTPKRPLLPPSGPLALPIIGHLHLLRQPLHQTLARFSTRYGPILLLRFGLRRVLLLSTPSIVEECFIKNDVTFANRPFLLAFDIINRHQSTLATAPYGPNWRNQRRVTTLHVLSSARITALSSARTTEVISLLCQLQNNWSEGFKVVVNMKERFANLTFNVMMRMIGTKKSVENEAERRFQVVINEAFHLSGASNMEDFLPIMRLIGMHKKRKQMERVAEELDDLLQNMIQKHRILTTVGEEKTIIDIMLTLQEEDEFYTDDAIKGLIQDLILAGTDTSAGTMEWALSLLLNNPEVLRKTRDEIDIQVGHNKLVTDSDLSNLPYLHNVIKETLRLFPAGPLLLPHRSSKDCIVGGYHIPCDTMLLVNVYAMHRDPKLWKDPMKFRPERFEDGEGAGNKYMPFGLGRRRCPGEGLAIRMIALALGSLIQCFEWKRIGYEEVDLGEGEGLSLPKAIPLEAMYKPREKMVHILSQL